MVRNMAPLPPLPPSVQEQAPEESINDDDTFASYRSELSQRTRSEIGESYEVGRQMVPYYAR